MIKLSERGEQVLREAIAAIEMDIEHWNQAEWVDRSGSCGTTACLAGWIVATQDHQSNLNALSKGQIPGRALDLLEISSRNNYGWERELFRNDIFHALRRDQIDPSQDHTPLAGTIENLKYLKERIAAVTGIEL